MKNFFYVFGLVFTVLLILGVMLFVVPQKDKSDATVVDTDFVDSNDTVTLDYELTVDGNIVDSSFDKNKPFVFTAGSGQAIKGFNNAVLGMKVGEERTFSVQPEDGYGDANSFPLKYEEDLNLILESIKAQTDKNVTPEQIQGGTFFMQDKLCKFTSFDLNKNLQYVDCQHRLAGKVLVFKVKVLGIEKAK